MVPHLIEGVIPYGKGKVEEGNKETQTRKKLESYEESHLVLNHEVLSSQEGEEKDDSKPEE